MASLKVSIITVCFNSVETLRDTIESVISQDYSNVEYIIVDGGSTDGTMDLVREYEDQIGLVISESDNGIYDAMNKGIALTTGDIVGCLNSDDFYFDSAVLTRVSQAMSNQEADACYGDLIYVDRYDTNRVIRLWKSSSYSKELLERGWVPAHPTFFVRRTLYENYGVFHVNYLLAADYELMVRFLFKYGITTRYVPSVMVKMRAGGETNKSLVNILKQNVEIMKAAKKNGMNMRFLQFFIWKIVNRVNQYIEKVKTRDD